MLERTSILKLKPSDIKVGDRARQDMGDIGGLAESIESIGLLHPIVVDEDYNIIVGARRLEAVKSLGCETIDAIVACNLAELDRQLQAERDENTCRKDFVPSEAVAIGEKIERALPSPEARKAEAGKRGGKKAGRGRPDRDSQKKTIPKQDHGKRTDAIAAKAGGMSRTTYHKAKEITNKARKQPNKYDQFRHEMDRTGKVSGVYRRMKNAEQAEQIAKEPPPLPEGPFRVIVVDPPWDYAKRKADPTQRGALPYASMSLEDIQLLPVPELSHDDCILWLWTTNAHMPHAFGIAESWGFKHKTILTWLKDRLGTGDWLRGKTEHCLMCVKGKPTVTLTNQTTAIHGPVREHSRKPDEFYELVNRLCPGSKVELFARTQRQGWASHGAETDKFKGAA